MAKALLCLALVGRLFWGEGELAFSQKQSRTGVQQKTFVNLAFLLLAPSREYGHKLYIDITEGLYPLLPC